MGIPFGRYDLKSHTGQRVGLCGRHFYYRNVQIEIGKMLCYSKGNHGKGAVLNRYMNQGAPWHWHKAVELFYVESEESVCC